MNNHPRRFFFAITLPAITILLGSCNLFDPVPNYRITEPEAVVPKNFLYNPDRDYNEWLDTPQRVNYHKATLDQIFSEPPFSDFRYELHEIPDDMDPITVDALGHTRRQLLWAISHDNNLKMTLLTTAGGRPSVVVIRWRGSRRTARPEIPTTSNKGPSLRRPFLPAGLAFRTPRVLHEVVDFLSRRTIRT